MPGQSFYVIPEKRHEQRIQKMNLETLIVCVVILMFIFALLLLHCICKVSGMHSRGEEERDNRNDL